MSNFWYGIRFAMNGMYQGGSNMKNLHILTNVFSVDYNGYFILVVI